MYEWNHTQLLLPNVSRQSCTVPSPTQFNYSKNMTKPPQLLSTPEFNNTAGTSNGRNFTPPIPYNVSRFYYVGGVLLPDGGVVLVPHESPTIGLFDPATNTLFSGPNVGGVTGGFGQGRYKGGVLLPDGRVLFVPYRSPTIGLYDPANNTFMVGPNVTKVNGSLPAGGGSLFDGGVLMPDGRVLFVPEGSPTIGLYDPTTNTFTVGPNVTSGRISGKWSGEVFDGSGGVMLPDGRVLLVPNLSEQLGLYDPATNTFTVGPDVPTSWSGSGWYNNYAGGVLLPNGQVVLVPRSAQCIVIYDPAKNAIQARQVSGDSVQPNKFAGGVLLPDGRVLFAPMDGPDDKTSYGHVGLYDPATGNYTTGPQVQGGESCSGTMRFCGAVLLPNGRVVFVPHCSATVGWYDPGDSPAQAYALSQPLPPSWNALLLPYYNKY